MTPFPDWRPHGVIPAVLLPFRDDFAIDAAAYRHHLRDVAAVAGITALTVNGHSSEVHACTAEEQREVLRLTMDEVGDRLAWFGGLGDDCVPEYFAIGVQAYTSSISNIAPTVSLALAEAGMARDFKRLNALMTKYVHPLYALRERMKGYEVAVTKEAMEMLGMPAGPVRPPLSACRPQDVEALRKIVAVYRASLEAGAA